MPIIADSKFLRFIPTFWLLITTWIKLIIVVDQEVEGAPGRIFMNNAIGDAFRQTCGSTFECKGLKSCTRFVNGNKEDKECKCRSWGDQCKQHYDESTHSYYLNPGCASGVSCRFGYCTNDILLQPC